MIAEILTNVVKYLDALGGFPQGGRPTKTNCNSGRSQHEVVYAVLRVHQPTKLLLESQPRGIIFDTPLAARIIQANEWSFQNGMVLYER